MKRYHFFEFGDQSWIRGWFREAYLDALNFALRAGGQYDKAHGPFSDWAARADASRVLDLGSGGGGPIETMVLRATRAMTPMPLVVLSDRHPSPAHYEELAGRLNGRIGFVPEPVSATAVNRSEYRLRSLCSVFHHFPPVLARQVIADAARHCDGIFILEPVERNLRHLCMMLVAGPFPYMLAPFFARRFSLRKLLVGTLAPIIPFMLLFDGCVSVFRVYTKEEIEDMFPPDTRERFELQSGRLAYGGVFNATYFCATLKEKHDPQAQ